MTKNRLEAFSDGVFAIVITLLILDVRFPADKPLTLETLWGVAPHLWAFVLSFVIVGVYWVSHHNMLYFIRTVDRQLLWLNLTLLLLVVFIPFPAALLGQHADNELAVALYGINLMLVNAAGTAMWLYATSRPHLAADGMTPALSRFVAKIHSAPILVYAAAIALAPPARAHTVVVNGEVVVREGRLLTADEDDIAREIAATSLRLAG